MIRYRLLSAQSSNQSYSSKIKAYKQIKKKRAHLCPGSAFLTHLLNVEACHSMASPESQLTIPEALGISAQDKRGDMKPAMTKSHRETFDKMLQRVQAQPTTYIMTSEESAVFRHYPDAFIDNGLAQEAVQRFWEYRLRKLVDEQEAEESKDFHIKTPKTDSLQDRNSTFDPFPRYNTQSQNQARVATRVSRRNNTTRYRSRASTTADKGACELCIQRRLPCDGKRPYCGCCGRANFLACVYAGGTGDFSLKPPVFDTGIMRSNESSVTPTLSHQSSVQLRNLSSFEGCDRTDKHDAADACEQHGQKRTECEEEHPESSENLSQEPHEKIRISYGAYRERNPVSRDGQANKEDEPRLQTWDTSPDHLKSSESLSLDLSQFRMRILNGTEYNFTNSLKLRFQSLTGEPWDWWPLRPCFQQLLDDEVRIHWYCVSHCQNCLALGLLISRKDSGHAHWTVLSKSDLVLALEALNSQATTRSVPSERKNPQSSSKSRSSARSSRSSGSETSLGDSSPATSEGGSSDQPDDYAGSGKKTEPSGTSTAVDIIPPSSLVGFVLFGVHGSKRLHNASLRLAQINVAAYKDDDSFFEEMNVQYQTLRGFLRRVFSIWIFHTCEFIMV